MIESNHLSPSGGTPHQSSRWFSRFTRGKITCAVVSFVLFFVVFKNSPPPPFSTRDTPPEFQANPHPEEEACIDEKNDKCDAINRLCKKSAGAAV